MDPGGPSQQQGKEEELEEAGTFEQFTELLAQGNLLHLPTPQRGQGCLGRGTGTVAVLLEVFLSILRNALYGCLLYGQALGSPVGSCSNIGGH